MKHTLQSRIYPLYVGLIILAVASTALYSSIAFNSFYRNQKERELTETAELLATIVPKDVIERESGTGAQDFCVTVGASVSSRITIVRPDGTVAGDSGEEPSRMENHAGRPEIRSALSGVRGVSIRYSDTLSTDMMYVAVPIGSNGRILGVLRTAASVSEIRSVLRDLFVRSTISGFVAILITAFMSYLLVKRISNPLSLLHRAAERYAGGELDFRVSVDGPDEFRSLAETMNGMAEQLRVRIGTVTSQRNELDGILSSMIEAVFVLDASFRIRTTNHAARNLPGAPEGGPEGKNLLETFRNSDLQDFAERTFAADGFTEENITLYGKTPVHLQAHGTVLVSEAGKRTGVLIVLNDITRLVKLEEIRKDFVANVSHELRTPVTSIRGFVETLQEGAVEDPDTAKRFLSIIGRQAGRLSAIIEDLLTLSRLEQGDSIRMEESSIGKIVREAVELCSHAASVKNIALECSLPEDALTARVSDLLLEQAVTNLVDNAIKYSDPGTSVLVSAGSDGDDIVVSVRDEGCGIPAKDLPRIFERFYRVDRARSRTLGGTGLGLAIVKHIALVHRGSVSVSSAPGKGSVFTFRIPRTYQS